MELIDKLRAISKLENIPESDLILDEAEFFIKFHEGHGCYQMELFYNEHGILDSMDLRCLGTQIEITQGSTGSCDRDKYPTSVVYSPCEEDIEYLAQQKARRKKYLASNS